ncbi:MAG TPA: Ig-like domain-containing protein [Nitrososphaeraceae archaeon]|nr:Ig-like domain-containing protein [Nitrososphaeraceae archaeon]
MNIRTSLSLFWSFVLPIMVIMDYVKLSIGSVSISFRSLIINGSLDSHFNTIYRKPKHMAIMLKTTAAVLAFLILSTFITMIPNAYALAPVVQIASAKALNQDILTSRSIELPSGSQKVKVDFTYSGFDDNNHIIQFECSWDGTNYAKSNCSTESPEAQRTFIGPDGVSRTYYVKTGSSSREFPVGSNHFFGVRVINDAGTASPVKTFTFDVVKSSGSSTTTVKSVFPADGVMSLRSPAHIIVRFTAPVQDSSVSSSTFTIKDNTGKDIIGAVTRPVADGATFKPQERLVGPREYTVRLDGIKDSSGNSLSPYEWSFSVSERYNVPSNIPQASYEKVKLTVTFDSVTIHDNHEGFGEGTGEYALYSFVQGKGINLAKASEFGVCGGDPDYCGGVWESSNGETVKFQPGSEITLELDRRMPLSVSAFGFEVDGCPNWYIELADRMYPIQIFSDRRTQADWTKYIDGFFRDYYERYGDCALGEDHNELGTINEVYYPRNGVHSEGPDSFVSNTGDYTLRYTISVDPIPLPTPRP